MGCRQLAPGTPFHKSSTSQLLTRESLPPCLGLDAVLGAIIPVYVRRPLAGISLSSLCSNAVQILQPWSRISIIASRHYVAPLTPELAPVQSRMIIFTATSESYTSFQNGHQSNLNTATIEYTATIKL
jgi:hypothetical protein